MWNGMSILYPKSRIVIELQRENPACRTEKPNTENQTVDWPHYAKS